MMSLLQVSGSAQSEFSWGTGKLGLQSLSRFKFEGNADLGLLSKLFSEHRFPSVALDCIIQYSSRYLMIQQISRPHPDRFNRTTIF